MTGIPVPAGTDTVWKLWRCYKTNTYVISFSHWENSWRVPSKLSSTCETLIWQQIMNGDSSWILRLIKRNILGLWKAYGTDDYHTQYGCCNTCFSCLVSNSTSPPLVSFCSSHLNLTTILEQARMRRHQYHCLTEAFIYQPNKINTSN